MSMSYDEIKAHRPKRYEVRRDGTFWFLLEDGRWVKLMCDFPKNEGICGNTVWDIRYKEEKEGIHYLIFCHVCGKGGHLISILPAKKP